MRILIVEDEYRMAKTIQTILKNHDYTTDIAEDGESGLAYILSGAYDLVILDWMLPRQDGLQVLRGVRGAGVKTPILMLSARAELEDRIAGLDCGADYYLTKPFSAAELLACVRALLRRPQSIADDALRYGDLKLNIKSGSLSTAVREVMLNRKERDVMQLLMKNAGQPVSREVLFSNVWGFDSDSESNVLEAYMSFLRKKLAFVQSEVRIISLRRIGYCLTERRDAE